MAEPRKILVLLPAYNEEASLEKLLDALLAVGEGRSESFTIVVCNDGSVDRTAEILERRAAQSSRIVHLRHRRNRGLGETIRDLFEYAVDNTGPDDVLIRMDCDDTHDPRYIPAMIAKLDEGYDVIIASRFQEGGAQVGVEGYRAFISYAANGFMKLFFNIKGVREYSCGYRAYRSRVISRALDVYGGYFLQLKGLGFVCTLEKLVKLNLIGARFAEIPFILRYDKKESTSKMVGSVTTLGYLVLALMYHWPWGGWRTYYHRVLSENRRLDA